MSLQVLYNTHTSTHTITPDHPCNGESPET
jgi:hypothetical protein